jgi:hypothetical protein
MNLLLADAEQRPELFRWNGPVERGIVEQVLAATRMTAPADLIDFWAATGGGVEFSPAYYPIGSFETFNEWYCDIRRDFAETYGLTRLPIVPG